MEREIYRERKTEGERERQTVYLGRRGKGRVSVYL